jgi:hypothetical protein
MASLESLSVRNLLRKGVVLSAGTDTPVAIRIRHLGSETVTSVTVTTGTNIVLVGSTTTDTVTFATDTTLAKVVARLNGTGRWEAKLLDALSGQLSTSTLLDGAITSGYDTNGNVVWDVKQDTSTALEIGRCISAHRAFDVPMGRSRVHLKEIKYSVNMGTAAVDSVQVYTRKIGPTNAIDIGTQSLVVGYLSVDTTETTITWASGEAWISADVNEEIYVRVKDAATLADATGNFVQVAGFIE